MKITEPLRIILLLTGVFLHTEALEDTLKFTQIIFRHGERTTDFTYGIYKEMFSTFWPEGVGELTNTGKSQAHELGKFLRARYDGFISNSYKSKEISSWCSSKDRVINSVLISMLGLFDQQNSHGKCNTLDPMCSEALVPVRTIPKESDMFLSLSAKCPRRDEVGFALSMEYFREYCTAHPQIFEYLYNNTGEQLLKDPLVDQSSARIFFSIIETILSLAETGKIVEDWMRSDFLNEILPLLQIYPIEYWLARTKDLECFRLHVGPLLGLLVGNFISFHDQLRDEKMIVHGSHDNTIAFLMAALGIYDAENLPPYAAALILELHEIPEFDEPIIQFLYRNETNHPPYHLISPYCASPCTLSSLINFTSWGFVGMNYEEECRK